MYDGGGDRIFDAVILQEGETRVYGFATYGYGVGFPTYGILGAAFAAMFSLCFWNITTLIYIKLKFGRTTGYFPVFW